jgi:hypothetical protein
MVGIITCKDVLLHPYIIVKEYKIIVYLRVIGILITRRHGVTFLSLL